MFTHLRHTAKLGVILTMIALFGMSGGLRAADEPSGSLDRAGLRNLIVTRIDGDGSLNREQHREMIRNLDRALDLGMTSSQIEGLFPMGDRQSHVDGAALLRMQDRVLGAGEDGLPADLLADKLREGRMKRANVALIERAVQTMDDGARIALGSWSRAVDQGVDPVGGDSVSIRLKRGLALNVWRGLRGEEMDRLREVAVDRASQASCTTIEFAAAAETATELIEHGLDRTRAMDLVSTGLGNGFDGRELREVSQIVRAISRGRNESALDSMYQWMQQRFRSGETTEQMVQQMTSMGWMGPRDMHSPGGYSPVDDVMGGPGNHHDDGWGDPDRMGGDGHGGHGDPPGGDGHMGGGH